MKETIKMKHEKDTLIKTNKYLSSHEAIVRLVSKSATYSTLVEGVDIQNFCLSYMPENLSIVYSKDTNLWD